MSFRTQPSVCIALNHHLLCEVRPSKDDTTVDLDLTLDPGNSVKGRVVGPDGEQLSDAWYSGGITAFSSWRRTGSNGKFTVNGYDTAKQRRLTFFQHDENLAGQIILSGALPQELVVKLQPAGKIVGRLVGDDGEPLADRLLISGPLLFPSLAAAMAPGTGPEPALVPLPPNQLGQRQYHTDENGRFEIDGLVPDTEYHLCAHRRSGHGRIGSIKQAIKVRSGETLDLGDVKLRPPVSGGAGVESADAR